VSDEGGTSADASLNLNGGIMDLRTVFRREVAWALLLKVIALLLIWYSFFSSPQRDVKMDERLGVAADIVHSSGPESTQEEQANDK